MEQTTPGLPAQQAVERLRAFAESWREADVPEARADLVHAIYEKIVVAAAASSQLASFPRHASTVWLGSCPSLLWRARRDSNTLHQRSQLAFLLSGGAGKRRRDESHRRRLELCRRLSLLRVVELLASREARTQWPLPCCRS
jgi:hypothetical protein